MFCRNCGKGLVGTPEICANCGADPVEATSFCRFCGDTTNSQEVMCPQCGAAIRTFAKSGKGSTIEGRGRFATTRTVFKILAAVTFVSVYIVLALPPRTALRPLQSAASDLVVATVGYSSLPLDYITAYPYRIPEVYDAAIRLSFFYVNDTRQLTIYAMNKKPTINIATGIATGSGSAVDITTNCTYRSSNTRIATVTSGGFVLGVAPGTANITVTYTAAPGSANISSAAQGKIPVTFTIMVPVTVLKAPMP